MVVDPVSRREFVAASLGAALLPHFRSTLRPAAAPTGGPAPGADRPRVVVCTDIGGTDFDDFQSMVHLLVYADSLQVEGLISSPMAGLSRKRYIIEVIDRYERDYPSLRTYSDRYPAPHALRAITRQGAVDAAGYSGVGSPTEGSEWLVRCARRDDPRPLHVLIWGGIGDLAQALHDAPDILPKLRVYYIGGPNKKWSVDAYHYVATHHPGLWMIEANSTYRGWFVGGHQEGEWGNQAFVTEHVAGMGALGAYFATIDGTIKMGDTPSVAWLLRGSPEEPCLPGWGGRFVRAWDRPHAVFHRPTSEDDRIEQFGVFELALPAGAHAPGRPEARMVIENQELVGYFSPDATVRFRFSPKEAKTYHYTLRSNVPALNGLTGGLTAVPPEPSAALRPSSRWPNWWTDDPSPYAAEGPDQGARTVSEWREQFLSDFAARMRRCAAAAR